jgi:hypothetical protein
LYYFWAYFASNLARRRSVIFMFLVCWAI